MRILGIETSCDETGAAVIEGTTKVKPVKLLSNVLATSLAKHAETGGIIPEIAAREQVKYIIPVIREVLLQAKLNEDKPQIDAIAVTFGPGLIGSLLVGVETAKTLAYLWNIPLIPVNHLYGHIYANWIVANGSWEVEKKALSISYVSRATPRFPAIALVVSGGHTDLVLIKKHGELQVIGGTRDDAAGEAFDKIGRLLGLPYPAGPVIAKLAKNGDPKAFRFPRPMWDSGDYDFSFSGLKTAVLNLVRRNSWQFDEAAKTSSLSFKERESFINNNNKLLVDLCASVQQAIVDVLVSKTVQAVKEFKARSLLLGGGVAANKQLAKAFKNNSQLSILNSQFSVPPPNLCTDNAAMIAAAGFYNDQQVLWKEVTADPELYY